MIITILTLLNTSKTNEIINCYYIDALIRNFFFCSEILRVLGVCSSLCACKYSLNCSYLEKTQKCAIFEQKNIECQVENKRTLPKYSTF